MALLCSPSIYIFTKISALEWYYASAASALMVALLIWLLFDGLYNWVRGYGWWFTGSDDKDDAATDNILQRLKLWQHILLKIGLLLVSLAVYLYYLRLFS